MSDQVVPHNEAAENALTSSCLISPNALDHAEAA